MSASSEDRITALRTLIDEVAVQRQVPGQYVALLTDRKLERLVQKGLTTTGVLQRTTYDGLVAAGVAETAAKVLKTLFPDPDESEIDYSGNSESAAGAQNVEAHPEIIQERFKKMEEVSKAILERFKAMEEVSKNITACLVRMHRRRHPPAPSSDDSDNWRDNCLDAYDPPELRLDDATLPCVALGRRYETTVVKPAHIYRRRWDRYVLEDARVPVHSASNVIPLHESVKRALDCFRITIIPEAGDVFTLKVLDPSLRVGEQSCAVDGIRWEDLDGTALTFNPGVRARPSAWVCAFHAKHALEYATSPLRLWVAKGTYQLPRFAREVLRSQSPDELHVSLASMSDSGMGGGSGSNAASLDSEAWEDTSENEEGAASAPSSP